MSEPEIMRAAALVPFAGMQTELVAGLDTITQASRTSEYEQPAAMHAPGSVMVPQEAVPTDDGDEEGAGQELELTTVQPVRQDPPVQEGAGTLPLEEGTGLGAGSKQVLDALHQ